MTERVDAIVVGAGVVGLACARRLALNGLETIVIEKERAIGQGISSRNSEVIHAGIYYKPGSLKARLAVRGRDALYDYCRRRNVPHRQIGKWIVAQREDQRAALAELAERGRQNGVDDLRFVERDELRRVEPALNSSVALESPSTGIVDSHTLMLSLAADFESAGGVVACNNALVDASVEEGGIEVSVSGDQARISTRCLVNAAGLSAPAIARRIRGLGGERIPSACYAKGNYFCLSGGVPFSRLIYPLPEIGGLGVHLTLDLHGQARFGPDVEWVDEPDYRVDAARRARFAAAIRRYWPDCPEERLYPGFAGVRPKLGSPESFLDDFVIDGPAEHGISGLVNLFGIESPGLTASLAIADEVASRLVLN